MITRKQFRKAGVYMTEELSMNQGVGAPKRLGMVVHGMRNT
jgi:hypothetical protein